MFCMDDLKVPKRRYYSDEKISATFRWPKPLRKRLKQEAEALGMKESDLIMIVLDLWCQRQDELSENPKE